MKDFKTYHKIHTLGHEENKEIFSEPEDLIVIQEKIDGGNFRFYITSTGKVIFGTKTQQITDDEGNDANVNKMFKRCTDFVRTKLSLVPQLEKYSKYVFFGECCVKHTINYDWEKMPLYLGFDIFDLEEGRYIEDSPIIFNELGLVVVPLLNIVTAKNIPEINDNFVPISKYALSSSQDQKAEGVVFKNYKKQIFAKYVLDAFKEKNAETFGGNPKYNKDDDTDNAEFIFKYCTNPRIEKVILKEIEKGKSLGMEMMGSIIKETYLDIIEEEWREILNSNWKLDFKECRKKIAPRCRAVLGQMMVNNAR